MRFMVLIKADQNTEAGILPDERLLAEMGNFNEELVNAGVMLAGEGLHPSSKGARVVFSGANRTVIDGPFPETKELIAGFWLWQVKSIDEAIAWVKRCPNPTGGEAVVEIRQVFEADDFGAEFTPELRAQEERLRAQIAAPSGNAMQIQPYLYFDGRCEEALEFYRQTLGAEVLALMRFKESPDPGMREAGGDDKVMHACFRIGESTVLASDGRCENRPTFQGFSLSLTVPNDAEAERLFAAVGAGGQVQMPLMTTFFASRFGMVADRFGVSWMIYVAP